MGRNSLTSFRNNGRPLLSFPSCGCDSVFPVCEIRTLSGVGPAGKADQKVAGSRLVDLVFDLPVGPPVVDRSYRPRLAAAEAGRIPRWR